MLLNQSINKELTSFLIFHINDRELCLDMNDLVKIMDLPESSLKNNKDSVMEFGGLAFNILNLSKIFKLKKNKINCNSKMILLEVKERAICFIADKIVEILASNDRASETRTFIKSTDPYLKGIMQYEGRDILVPDFGKIIIDY